MTSIFPGGNALNAANITKKQHDQSAALMEKISNGKRLITGADDAGNINKVNNIKAKVLSTNAAIRSVTDIMSMAQLADQGYSNINKMLLRANELALQSTNKIYKDADRIALNNEIQNIIDEIDNIAIGKLEDVDVPKTVVSLQKANYIQSIATAMVNRVKSTMEAVLQILDR